MKFNKDFLVPQGFTANFVICKEIKFDPINNKAIIVLQLYKDQAAYEADFKKCTEVEVEVNDTAYENFITTSGLYTKATAFLLAEGNILENAIEITES